MNQSNPPSGWQRFVLIALRVLFGLIFLAAGTSKLLGAEMMVQEFGLFAAYGIGQWFRYLTGALEIIGAVLLIRPRTVTPGATLLVCISIGALVAQLVVIHQDPIHAILFALLLGWIAYAYRGAMSVRS
ncbi:putative membrane protein YphA (DoxX/SURF4 family) [Sphingomonas vulcanisoli]|uniref:Membrane protein YphA (DoxX/SURF4 family) n=1 Tax=Sphingomonas vulcanisoli TaxID=1658060 RepID=A0ABX0TP61_9SPHN|nr:DoxX family protein [Sphingomonas vulcanisoli]NIJ07292.1 putative membrane protein YphA (DoxX/SURF4 family) [Sphingomonas vulcanisoli]